MPYNAEKLKKLKTVNNRRFLAFFHHLSNFYISTNNEDYILGIGCSNTEGIGVHNEDTWLEKLGRMLGLKTINFGYTHGSKKTYIILTLIFFILLF